jgi:hypothetical protein
VLQDGAGSDLGPGLTRPATSSETEADVGPGARELRRGACDLPRPDQADRPVTLDRRQMVEGVIGHELERGRERLGRDDPVDRVCWSMTSLTRIA